MTSKAPTAVALLGGSFNPPHIAHVLATAYVLSTSSAQQVWWIPVFRHALAKRTELLPFSERSTMARLACEIFGDRVLVSEIEREMGGTSYTVDTVAELQRQNPNTAFFLVVGSDIFAESHLWKDWDRLRELLPFIVLHRTGTVPPPGEPASPPLPPLSSREVRERLLAGLPCDTLVPKAVLNHIHTRHLYSGDHI
ncbi:MAG: nicotinate (nicotinamide) nucleotide adenylyltransferase [Myxococcales bacterium]|nr:nicotinate (nicotinamide) nucleotide adenylyltransferase [Myxococcales bacterium]